MHTLLRAWTRTSPSFARLATAAVALACVAGCGPTSGDSSAAGQAAEDTGAASSSLTRPGPVQWNGASYNSAGYNSAGHNSADYNSAGYNSAGYNSAGYNSAGYNSAGYNSAGYNSAGYNSAGYNS